MRTTLRLTAAAIVATGVLSATATAVAQPAPIAAESDTGSAAADAGSAAGQSAVYLAQNGDLIGLIVLLGITPFQMLTSGICDLATMSSLYSPCSPGRTHYTVADAELLPNN
ncbi:hypothetical protein [Nocardia caishijiensis]|uniref:Uncharacterized protein n=1 Tax=Nocardia caishijiensis TaxID=184756 RepID=A0ABQ6YIX6_9NOCA|nr:hypothetical protein [Nocardia caishijiensis]KAF0845737.1 hypothetical protein FNL39_106125 [Nocardia caishijiensis]